MEGLDLSPDTPLPTLPLISSDRLALTSFNLTSPELILRNSQLQLDNWRNQPQSWGLFSGTFQLSAKELHWQQLALRNVLLDGDHNDQHWKIYGFSFNWQHASLSGQAEYLATAQTTETILLHQLTISDLQLQDSELINTLQSHLGQLLKPSVKLDVRRLDILDSSIERPDYTINDGNLSLHNWSWPASLWHQRNAFLSLGASSIRWKNTVIDEPLVELAFSPQQINIEGMSANLLSGYVQTDGTITPDTLALNQLTINGIKWFLPEQWLTQLHNTSRYFNNISLTTLDIGYTNLLPHTPSFPFSCRGSMPAGMTWFLNAGGRLGYGRASW